jgi:pimeloyl-ACP methyl ester carboxylesterase
LASLPESPIRKLLINDVGPELQAGALARIGDYLGKEVRFPNFEQGVQYIRTVSASFGPHTDEQWRKLAADVLREDKDGQWKLHYDLALSQPFKATTPEMAQAAQAALWTAYDAIRCETLLVRGAESDLLSPGTAQQMTQRGPKAHLIELPGVGHAPTFVQPDQIEIAKKFFFG